MGKLYQKAYYLPCLSIAAQAFLIWIHYAFVFFLELTMRPNILPAFVLCAILLIEAKAQEQSSSGFNTEGFATDDDGSGADGSGASSAQDGMQFSSFFQ